MKVSGTGSSDLRHRQESGKMTPEGLRLEEDSLTITVTGETEHVDVLGALSVVHSAIDLLMEIDCAVARQRNAQISWRFSAVSMNSPLVLTIVAHIPGLPQFGREVLGLFIGGLRGMEYGTRSVPRYFTDNALEDAKRIVAPLNTGTARIAFTVGDEAPLVLSQRIAASADILLPKEHVEIGSLEGRLEMLSVHGRTQFAIWDVITDARVECNFPASMLEQTQECFNRRVLVSGEVRYSRNGLPRTIKVDQIRPLRDQRDLPQARDLENRTGKRQWTVNAID
jgi:hypothetical protein